MEKNEKLMIMNKIGEKSFYRSTFVTVKAMKDWIP